jgi:hypothetical protein
MALYFDWIYLGFWLQRSIGSFNDILKYISCTLTYKLKIAHLMVRSLQSSGQGRFGCDGRSSMWSNVLSLFTTIECRAISIV